VTHDFQARTDPDEAETLECSSGEFFQTRRSRSGDSSERAGKLVIRVQFVGPNETACNPSLPLARVLEMR
jgi:hypothetical protein